MAMAAATRVTQGVHGAQDAQGVGDGVFSAEHGTHAQKQRWCPGILTGEVVQAMGLTEPGCGSDVSSLQTRARLQGGDYLLSGNKCYMSSGDKADLLYVVAKTDRDVEQGRGAITMFLVDKNTPGVTMRRMDTLGMRASSIGEWFLEDVRVSKEDILGAEGEALKTVLKGTFIADRTIIASRALAVGKGFMESLPRAVVAGRLDSTTATTAKLWTTEVEYRVADTCLQLHGGYGYMTESAISRIYTYARVEPIYGGTSEIQKVNIARSLR